MNNVLGIKTEHKNCELQKRKKNKKNKKKELLNNFSLFSAFL